MMFPEDQLVLGRGRVYFNPFTAGTRVGQGERYIGNTTTFQVTREVVRQGRMVSIGGRKFDDTGYILAENHKVTFVTDSISVENMADFFGQQVENELTATGFVTETFTLTKGRFYQLGTGTLIFGVRNALVTNVSIGGVSRPVTDWESDTATGRLYIPPTSTIANGSVAQVTWESRTQSITSSQAQPVEIWGALRFISNNVEGQQKHVFMPCVRLFARGAIDFKGDQWQQMPFEGDATNLTPAVPQVVIDYAVQTLGATLDEEWLDENPINNFAALDDALEISANIEWPRALTLRPVVYTYDLGGIESPLDAGQNFIGVYDLLVDGVKVYLGLNAPFIRPDIGATTIRAYPSTLDNSQDYLLAETGERRNQAFDDLVLNDNDIWSVGNV